MRERSSPLPGGLKGPEGPGGAQWTALSGRRRGRALPTPPVARVKVESSTTAVSQHLAKLRLAGLVESRRDGTFVYYSASDWHVRRLLAEALSHAEHTTGVAPDTDRA